MIYRTDGRSLKSLTLEDVFGADIASNLTASGESQPRAYYALVPFVRRAIGLRANAVARVPITLERNGRDVSGRPEWAGLMGSLKDLLWRTEAAVCLSPYGATWRRVTNRAGLNPTPEWLLPHSVWPSISADKGLEYFRYTRPFGVPQAGHVEELSPEAVVYFWLPNFDRAGWPGPPPALTALAAAQALYNKDRFTAAFFGRGAIKSVLLQVPPETKPAERDRLQAWWRGITGGITSAWRSVVIQSSVTPVVLGDGLKDLNNESLTREYRQEVAAAFDIPETMLMQGAANYATAQNDRISFYEETVFPSVDRLCDAINTQWLEPDYDARLVPHPEQTEARQSAQLMQAEAITNLVGEPVLMRDEGRAWLGFDPLPRDEEAPGDPDADERADYAAMDADEDADEQAADVAEMVEDAAGEATEEAKRYARDATGKYRMLPGAPDRKTERQALMQAHRATRQETCQRHAAERMACRERHIVERRQAADAKTRLTLVHRQRADVAAIRARQRAERMVLRSLHTAERSRVLDRHAAQRNAEIAAWRTPATKADPLSPAERRLAAALTPILDTWGAEVVSAILAGEALDLGPMDEAIRAAILTDLTSVALASMADFAAAVGLGVDEAVAQTAASTWARQYAGELIRGVSETTRAVVQSATAAFLEAPGMSREQLADLVRGAFGRTRAETIAVTEVTRAASEGARIYQAQLAEAGLTFERVWRTANDDAACPVCAPLNGKAESTWSDRFPAGPPAHPNCRCAVTLRSVKQ